MVLDQPGEHADDGAAEQIHEEGAERKIQGLRSVQNEAAKFVTRNRAKGAADSDEQDLFRREQIS